MMTADMIEQLSNGEIIKLAQEAREGGSELDGARTLLYKELGRRGLLTAPESDPTGFVDALEDTQGMIEPSHVDQHWKTDFYKHEDGSNYIRGSD